MIKEAYVSFEVAKLLNEKGFDGYCNHYYTDDAKSSLQVFDGGGLFKNKNSYPCGVPYDLNEAIRFVVAPTQQMATAFVREKYDINIVIFMTAEKRYSFSLYGIEDGLLYTIDMKKDEFDEGVFYDTYEDAVDEALKYVLNKWVGKNFTKIREL